MNGNPPSGVNYRTAYFNNDTNSNGKCPTKMAFGEKADLLPTAFQTTNNTTLNYAAMWYMNGGGEILLGGGLADHGSNCAPGGVSANSSFGDSGWSVVPRLSYYGKLNFVNGKELVAAAG